MEQPRKIHPISALDSSNLTRAAVGKQAEYSNLIKVAYEKLVREGKPPNYVMTREDVAKALNTNMENLKNKLRSAFRSHSVQEVLAGLGLPSNYKERY